MQVGEQTTETNKKNGKKRRNQMKKARNVVAAIVLVAMTAMAMDGAAAETNSASTVVNLNTATATELSYLPGVGQSKAEAIIDYRSNRQFKKVEDLMRVKGIGRKTFKKIRSFLAVQGPTTAKGKLKVTN
jgi:competence protein ComEA